MNTMLLDPSKQLVSILIMFVEEIDEKHGFTKFTFIDDRESFDLWKKQGYLTQEEFNEANEKAKSKSDKPGMPEQSPPDPNKIIKSLRTWWTRMNWKQTNEINSACLRQTTESDGNVKIDIDAIKYRDMKLKMCLKKWDMLDDNNQEVQVTESIIDTLVPEVVQALLANFEKVTEASAEQLKN